MKKKIKNIEDVDFNTLHPNFYNVHKPYFFANKPLEMRLSSGFMSYNKFKDDKDFYEKATRFITRTNYSLFSFITRENVPSIRFNPKQDASYCGLTENKLQVGMKMLFNKKIPAQLRVDTIIATSFHEMYHKRYTVTDIKKNILKLPKFTKYYGNPVVEEYIKKFLVDETFKSIHNILEDRRIEALGAIDFPGYSFFFEESRKYCYFLHSGRKILPEYEMYILDYIMLKILMPELVDNFREIYANSIKILKLYSEKGEMIKEEYEAFEAKHKAVGDLFEVIDNYIATNETKIYSEDLEDINEASQEIYDLIPKQIRDEINSQVAKNEIKGFVKLTNLNGGESFAEYTDENGKLIEVDDDMTEFLEGVVTDELKKIEKEASDSAKNQETKITTEKIKTKDKNLHYTEFEHIEEPVREIDTLLLGEAKQISKNIVNNLGFLDSKYNREIQSFELSEGMMDEDELYSICYNNRHIFEEIEEIPAYSLDFGILLDESGSMCSRIREAKLATLSLLLGLKDNKHINMFVYGHTANHRNSSAIQIYKYYNTLERFTDYKRLFSADSRSNNADGYAIERVAQMMKESKSRDKILIVVSDGQPAASGYGGASAEAHVREVVDRLESEGILVIQICMAYIENSSRMFKHYVQFEKDGSFFESLKKILMTKLNQFADAV